eukprot:g6512.t1
MPVVMSLLSLRLFLVGQFSSAVDATPGASRADKRRAWKAKSAPRSREKKPRPKTAPPVGKVEVPLAPGEVYPRFFKREHWDEPERRTGYRQHEDEEEQEEGREPPVGPSAQWDEEPEDYLVRSDRDLFHWKLGCMASTALAGGQVLQTSAALEEKFSQLQKRDARQAEGAGVAPQVRSRAAKASKGPGANANQMQKSSATAAMLAETAVPAEALRMVTGAHLVHLMTSHPVYSREFTPELRANGIDPAEFADGPFLQPEAEIANRADTNKLRTSSHPSVDVERAKQLWSQHALEGLVRQPPENFPGNRKNLHTAMYGLRVPSSSRERRGLFGHRVLCAAWTLLLYVQRDGGGPQPVDWLWNALTQVKTSHAQRRADVAVDTSIRGRGITYDAMMRMLKSSASSFGSGPGPSASGSGLGAAQGRGELAAAGFPPPPQQRPGSSSAAGTNETEGSPDIAHQRLVDVWASDGDAYYRPFLVRVAAFILFGTGLDPATSSIGAGMNTKTSSPTSKKTKTGVNIPEGQGQGALQKFADARDGIVGLALAQVDFGELFAFTFGNDFSHFFQFLLARGELARGSGKKMRSLFRVVGGANVKAARLEAVGLEYVGGKVGQHRVGAWGAPAASSSGPSRGNVSKKAFATIEEWTEPAGQQAASGPSSEAFAPAYVVPAGAAPGIISAMQPRSPGLVYDDRRTQQDWPPPPPPPAAVEMDTAQMLWRARETGALYQEELLGIDGRGGGTGIGAEQVAQQPEGCYYGYGAYEGRYAAQSHQTAGGTWHYADPCPPMPLQMSTAPQFGWDGPPTTSRESRYNYPQQFSADRLEQMVLDSIRHCGPLYPVAPPQEGPHNPGEQHPVHHQQRDGPALSAADATRRPPVTGEALHHRYTSVGKEYLRGAFCMWDIAEAYRSRQGSADAQPMDVDATIDRTADAPPAGQVGPTEAPEARSFMKPPLDPEARIEDYDLVVADVLRRQMESNTGAGEVDPKAKLNATDLSYQQGKGNKLHSNSTMHNATWWAAAQQEQQDLHDSLLLSPATVAALLRENSEHTAKSDHVKQQALSAVADFLGRGIVHIPPRTRLRDIVVSQQQTGGGRVASYPESQHVVERVQAFGGFKNGLDTADSDVDVAAFVHLVSGQQRQLVGSTSSTCKSKSAQVLNEDQLRHVLFELARWTFPEGENSWRTVHGVFGQWKLRKHGAGQMRARVPVLPLVWRPGPPVRPASGFLGVRPWNDAGITTGRTSSQRHAGASRADAPAAGTSGGMGVGRGAAAIWTGPAAAGSTSPDPNEVLLDVTLNNYDAQQNTELIRSLTTGRSNSLTRDFLLLVKILMKRAGVVGAKEGWLSSHAWALVALHFLQMLRVVPVLSPEAEEPEEDVLEEEQPFSGPAGRGSATLRCRPPDADFKSPSSSCRSGSSASTGAPPPQNAAPASAGYSFLDRSPFSATWSNSVSTSPASRSPTLTAQSPASSAAAVSEDFSEFTIVELGEAHQVGEEGAPHLGFSTWGNPTSAPSPPPGLALEPPPGLDVQPHTPVQVASQRQPASARHPVPPLVEAALGLAASEEQGKPRSSREGSTSNAAWPFLWLDERPFAGGDWSPPEVHGDPRLRDLSPVALSGITINTLALFNTWEGHAYAKFLSVLLQHFVRYLEKNWEHFSTKGGYVLAVRPPPCTQQVSESSGTGGRGSGGSTSSCSFAFPVWTREAHRARGGQQGQHTSGHLITRDPTAKGNQWISIRDSHSKEEFFWKVDDLFRKLQRDAANPKKK